MIGDGSWRGLSVERVALLEFGLAVCDRGQREFGVLAAPWQRFELALGSMLASGSVDAGLLRLVDSVVSASQGGTERLRRSAAVWRSMVVAEWSEFVPAPADQLRLQGVR